jgi:hypothetical protein
MTMVIAPPQTDPIEVAVRTLLVNDPTLASLVATRVYQLVLPQNVVMPAVRIQLIDEPVRAHLRGADLLRQALVQVDTYGAEAQGYSAIAVVAAAVVRVMLGWPARSVPTTGLWVTGIERDARQASFEPDVASIRIRQDFLVWSRPLPA